MSTKKKSSPGVVPIKLPPAINSAGIQPVYTNNLQMSASPLDVSLFFNHVIQEGDQLTVERRASVVMSFPHFVAMVQVFNQQMLKIQVAIKGQQKTKEL